MSENKAQRLSKVAKELNVSVSTITDFLKSKGHVVENNPMAKLSDDLYVLLSNEYQSEKAAKEEAKQVTTSTRAKKESIAFDEDVKKEPKKVEEEEDIIIKNVRNIQPIVEKVAEPIAKKESPVAKAEEEIPKAKTESEVKLKVIDKIDLNALNSK